MHGILFFIRIIHRREINGQGTFRRQVISAATFLQWMISYPPPIRGCFFGGGGRGERGGGRWRGEVSFLLNP